MRFFRALLIPAIVFAVSAHARNFLESPHIEMESGRHIYVEMARASDPNKPTFLFLPGMFCAPLQDEKFIAALRAKGFGAIIMNFSLQAPSIALLTEREIPFFKRRELTLSDLANEVEFVAKSVREEFPGIVLIPVSLSYSTAVSPYLRSFTHIIETSPMTSTWAAKPEVFSFKRGLDMNPFIPQRAIRRLLDQMYFNSSYAITEFTIWRYKLKNPRRHEMNEGYEALARMAEEFNWDKASLSPEIHRDWIIAGGEDYPLKVHQKSTFEKFKKTQPTSRLIEIFGAGHIIKDSQPERLAEALETLGSGCENNLVL